MSLQKIYIVALISSMLFPGCVRERYFHLFVLFDGFESLDEGALVRFEGLAVGEVAHIDPLQDKILVDLRLSESTHIPVHSRIFIQSSLVGSSRVVIESSHQGNFLSSGDTVVGSEPPPAMFERMYPDSTRQQKANEAAQKVKEGIIELIEISKNDSTIRKNE